MVTFTSTILPTCVLVPIAVASSLLHQKCNLLKARVIIYAYQHVRLLPPESLVVNQSVLRSREPTLLLQSMGPVSDNALIGTLPASYAHFLPVYDYQRLSCRRWRSKWQTACSRIISGSYRGPQRTANDSA